MMVAVATAVQMLLTSAEWHACPPSGYPSRTVVTQLWSRTRSCTGLDETNEQSIIRTRLRVPLHRQPKTRRRVLHRLQRAVRRPCGRHVARMTGHRLMVIARNDD